MESSSHQSLSKQIESLNDELSTAIENKEKPRRLKLIAPKRIATNIQQNFLDALARLLTSKRESCMAICYDDYQKKLLVAGNGTNLGYARNFINELKKFIDLLKEIDESNDDKILEKKSALVKLISKNKIKISAEIDKKSAKKDKEKAENMLNSSSDELQNFLKILEEIREEKSSNKRKGSLELLSINKVSDYLKESSKHDQKSKINSWINYLLPFEDLELITDALKKDELDSQIVQSIKENMITFIESGDNGLHAEMKIIGNLSKESMQTQKYIGITKLSCLSCQVTINVLNEHFASTSKKFELLIKTCGMHGNVYKSWKCPTSFPVKDNNINELQLLICKTLEKLKGRLATVYETTAVFPQWIIENNNDFLISEKQGHTKELETDYSLSHHRFWEMLDNTRDTFSREFINVYHQSSSSNCCDKWQFTNDNAKLFLENNDKIKKFTDLYSEEDIFIRTDGVNIKEDKELKEMATIKKKTWILLPINLNNNHWGLLSVNTKKPSLSFYTSSSQDSRIIQDETEQVKPFFRKICRGPDIRLRCVFPDARQHNDHDCGVFLCFYIEKIVDYLVAKNNKPNFVELPHELGDKNTGEYINRFRQEWCKVGEKSERDIKGNEHKKDQDVKADNNLANKQSNFERNDGWLEAEEIDWAYQWLFTNYVPNNRFFLSRSSWATGLLQKEPGERNDIKLSNIWDKQVKWDKLALEGNEQLVFIPINNAGAGNRWGTHWSLLVYKLKAGPFYHLDSTAAKMNRPKAQELTRVLSELCGLLPNYQELGCSVQRDGYNCGVAAIAFTERIMQHYDDRQGLVNEHGAVNVSLDGINFGDERRRWATRLRNEENQTITQNEQPMRGFIEQSPKHPPSL